MDTLDIIGLSGFLAVGAAGLITANYYMFRILMPPIETAMDMWFVAKELNPKDFKGQLKDFKGMASTIDITKSLTKLVPLENYLHEYPNIYARLTYQRDAWKRRFDAQLTDFPREI